MPDDSDEAQWASDYFAAAGTVATWWDPLSEADPQFRDWILAQQTDLLSVANPSGRKVLDAGCGRGRAAIEAASMGATVTAVDISTEMLGIAQENAQRAHVSVDFQTADLHNLPFPDDSYDVVLHLEILLHLEDPRRVLCELGRVLKPNGTLVLTTNGQNPVARLVYPGKQGDHPASRVRLFVATTTNEIMSLLFGFTWRKTRVTGKLYKRFFNAPVRPTYTVQVREWLQAAGFERVYHRAIPRHLPRSHQWIALRS
jgi:ubiquinone/menaquinone biosynthesis C-methylase UbiE